LAAGKVIEIFSVTKESVSLDSVYVNVN